METNKELKNQECYDKNGKFLGWFSRSVATVTFIFRKKENKMQVLLQKRGKGCPDNVGKWCTSCGYLEFNITLEENTVKEALEECGFELKTDKLKMVGINSDPSENHQNVSIHYIYIADEKEDFDLSKAIGGEKDEVETVEWFDIGTFDKDNSLRVDVYKIYERDFAFNHDRMMIKYLSDIYDLKYKDDE